MRKLAASGDLECSNLFALGAGFVLELTLKAFIEAQEPGARQYGHHIDQLWAAAVRLGLPDATTPMPAWVGAIHSAALSALSRTLSRRIKHDALAHHRPDDVRNEQAVRYRLRLAQHALAEFQSTSGLSRGCARGCLGPENVAVPGMQKRSRLSTPLRQARRPSRIDAVNCAPLLAARQL